MAAYSQCRFGIGVSSGTDALLLALMALGIGAGDGVITSPFTFFATAGTIARAGARPLFCDIDPVSFNLAPRRWRTSSSGSASGAGASSCIAAAARACARSCRCICTDRSPTWMPSHRARRRHGLQVIEDAAQAIGAADARGRRAGTFGAVGCLSFFPTKNLGAFGDAGMCVTNDAALAERMEILRVHGGKPKYYHAFIGGNFRIDELQAAVLNVKLPHLDDWSAGRQRNAAFYDCRVRACAAW